MLHRQRLGSANVDLVCGVAGKHDQFLPRPCHRDIQPAFAAVAVERAEIHRELASRILPERDREEDHIAFVALHVFQILDDGSLDPFISEEILQRRIVAPGSVEQIEDQ